MHVTVRLYGSLGDLVVTGRRGAEFGYEAGEPRSVKDLIESLGVPHCEVQVVLVDGESAGFARVVRGGERIAVYPYFSAIDAGDAAVAGEPLPSEPRFVLDGHLGRLAAYLRALGVDAAHERDADDASIARVAAEEGRVVLTRDIGLLKRAAVRHGWWVRSDDPRVQFRDVVARFGLAARAAPFTRCLACNRLLAELPPGEVPESVPPRVREQIASYSRCLGCGRVFWRGSHHRRLSQLLSTLVNPAPRRIHS
jgi:uncharacterized protein with PIN domain